MKTPCNKDLQSHVRPQSMHPAPRRILLPIYIFIRKQEPYFSSLSLDNDGRLPLLLSSWGLILSHLLLAPTPVITPLQPLKKEWRGKDLSKPKHVPKFYEFKVVLKS